MTSQSFTYNYPRLAWNDVQPGSVVRTCTGSLCVRLTDGNGRWPTPKDSGRWPWTGARQPAEEVKVIECGLTDEYAEALSKMRTAEIEQWAAYRAPNATCEDARLTGKRGQPSVLVYRTGPRRWTLVMGDGYAQNIGRCADQRARLSSEAGDIYRWEARASASGDLCHIAAIDLTAAEIEQLKGLVYSEKDAVEKWLSARVASATATQASAAAVTSVEELTRPAVVWDKNCHTILLYVNNDTVYYQCNKITAAPSCFCTILVDDLADDDLQDLREMSSAQWRAWCLNRGVEVPVP